MSINSIIEALKANITSDAKGNIHLKDESALLNMFGSGTMTKMMRLRFIILIAAIVLCVVVTVQVSVFLVKDVIFFKPETMVNDRGAICMTQSCGREHYLYLLNAAECWTDTGIKVLKGDKVTVTASGSFFSDIAMMDSCAAQNLMPEGYPRVNVLYPPKSCNKTIPSDWMYNKNDDARFGSLLLLIKDDYELPTSDSLRKEIKQLIVDNKCHIPRFSAPKAGVLNFAVNDVFTKSKDYCERYYEDNVGDILLHISVRHNDLPGSIFSPSILPYCYRTMDEFIGWSCSLYILLLSLIPIGLFLVAKRLLRLNI